MKKIIRILFVGLFLFLIIAGTLDVEESIVAIVVLAGLIILYDRFMKKDQRNPLICKCGSNKLVEYDEKDYSKEFSCITEKGIRKQVKNVYQCKSCGRITIEIN